MSRAEMEKDGFEVNAAPFLPPGAAPATELEAFDRSGGRPIEGDI